MERFVRFEMNGQRYYGSQDGSTISVIQGDLFGQYTITDLRYPLDQVKLLPPCEPSKAICVGLNYRKHAAELTMNIPEEPILFLKPPSSIIGQDDGIRYWPMVHQLDYEAELVVVIGKEAHLVEEKDALDYVFGYTAGNDITARDLQRKDGQWTRSKSFDTFLSLGPRIVTGLNPSNISVQSYLNGALRQDGNTASLIFSIPYLVSYISHVMTLYPGDIIMTGTPEGVGPMQVGDRIEVRIEGIGSLVNQVLSPEAMK